MQSLDTKPNQEENLEKLSQDFDTPFSAPRDVQELIPGDFPSLDTGIDIQEWYDAGATAASSADLVDNRTVISYAKAS